MNFDNRVKWSRKKLIERLRDLEKKLGHSPSQDEAHSNYLPVSTYSYRFGSWNKAKEAAGLETVPPGRRGNVLSDEVLIDRLRSLAKRVGHTPTVKDLNGDPRSPSAQTYLRRFGSVRKAAKAAGLHPNTQGRPPSHLPYELQDG